MAKKNKPFILATLKSGANQIGTRLLDAVNDGTQTPDVVLGNVLNAVKAGAIATGQEVIRERLGKL